MFPSNNTKPVMKKEPSNLMSFGEEKKDRKEEGERAKKYSIEQFRSVGGVAAQQPQKRGHSVCPKESFDCFDSLLAKKSSGSSRKHHNNFIDSTPSSSSNQPTTNSNNFMSCDPFSMQFDIPQLHSKLS